MDNFVSMIQLTGVFCGGPGKAVWLNPRAVSFVRSSEKGIGNSEIRVGETTIFVMESPEVVVNKLKGLLV